MGWRDIDAAEFRWDGRTRGHHEAYYLVLSLPKAERGWWFRFTVEAPTSGRASASVWAASFAARDKAQTFALRHAVDVKDLTTMSGGLDLRIGQQELRARSSRGGLRTEEPRRDIRWNLAWEPVRGPFFHYPRASMYDGEWPATKVCAPMASVNASGLIVVNGEEIDVRNARGTVGHVWGTGFAHNWAWGHCSTLREDPAASVEALTAAPDKDGPAYTLVHLQDEDRHLAFNGLWTMKRALAEVSDRGVWTFRSQRGPWRLEGRFSAPLDRMVGVAYHGPNGETRACHHTDVADAVFHLYRRQILGWKLEQAYTSRSGAAFEIVQPAPVAGVPVFVE